MNKLLISTLFICLGITSSFRLAEGSSSLPSLDLPAQDDPKGLSFDDNKAHSMPLLSKSPTGDILLSWTEKDDEGLISYCFSSSRDQGKTFSEKKVIYSNPAFRNNRLFRAKILAKRDGSLWAIFSSRTDRPAPVPATQGGRGRGPAAELLYSVSQDGGTNWTFPRAVDPDTTKGLLRGFFDAIVLPNDEIAVAYLKDVKGSTKHEERDLRMVISKGGLFQEEKVLDPIVCDCCNISLLVDAKGTLHVYYRDNNEDVRDMARLSSHDNGQSFSASQIVYPDAWKISGCPHNGAVSTGFGESALISWYTAGSGGSGIRLATQEGKSLLLVQTAAARNQVLMASSDLAILLWEEGKDSTQLAYAKVYPNGQTNTFRLEDSGDALNPSALIVGDALLMAYEVKKANKKNGLALRTLDL